MNTTHIKKYAPLARTAFINAVTQRANELGIYESHSEQAIQEGQTLTVAGRTLDSQLKSARNKLINRVEQLGFTQLMEYIAYTWFNRLCAIRYMELHDYLGHGVRVLSTAPSQGEGWAEGTLPEILDHAQDVAEDLGLNRDHIIELKLAGNQDERLYRTLLLGQCHALHQAMPFLFEAIDDETELLLPDNLTRTDSILRGLVNDIPEGDWEQVEIIGWLYQFYISEKKDEVIGKVVKSEDIPAATQLFTPNWIVKYLVQNSVGRQWLQTYPDSSIKAGMEYYIEPAQQTDEVNVQIKAITPDSIEPETIKVLDPACGSGHILVEAYQVLKAIYEERGYRSRDIPQLILENNLFGLDIDDRAAQLAGFALMMLARADDRRIFSRDVKLNVLSLVESGEWLADSQQQWYDLDLLAQSQQGENQDLFSDATIEHPHYLLIHKTLTLFEQAKTFGSLIQVPDSDSESLNALLKTLKHLVKQGDSTKQKPAAQKLLPLIKQACLLAQKYDAVVANPPYMGGKGMNPALKAFAKKQFPDSKSDLFAMFMEHGFHLLKEDGFNAQVNMQSWMFLSSYEKLRESLLATKTIITMAHLGARAFGQISGEVVQTTAFVMAKNHIKHYQPVFFRLVEGNEEDKRQALLKQNNRFDKTQQDDFNKISGSPIAYWVSDQIRTVFSESLALGELAIGKHGMSSGNNNKFVRLWHEINFQKIGFSLKTRDEAYKSNLKWFPYNKGGKYRKWYGNQEFIINYWNYGYDMYEGAKDGSNTGFRHDGRVSYFKECISWSFISSSFFGVRFYPNGFVFDVAGSSLFTETKDCYSIVGFLCSKLAPDMMKNMNPTLNFQVGNVIKLPYKEVENIFSQKLIEKAKDDWNIYETSWDFQNNPLINHEGHEEHEENNFEGFTLRDLRVLRGENSLSKIYLNWQEHNQQTIAEMQNLEQENNRLFIDAYGLQDELTPEVPLEQITLTVNPKYRYGGKLSDETLENRFQSDTLTELISYAIGCMMGRYRLDKAGLVYAHAGNVDFDKIYNLETPPSLPLPGEEPLSQLPDESLASERNSSNAPLAPSPGKGRVGVGFLPDDDGIIPLTDQEWFADDATHRFREFVRVVWGEDNLQTNLDFIAGSLCLYAIKPKSSESSLASIRRYLSSQLYKDHLKTYKKRPIYWLFSSGKQKAFECLVYLHRYNESTLSRMRTEYVTPLLGKYEASAMVLEKQMQDASTTAESNRYKKSLTALEKKQTELSDFDDKLKHYADMRISLDLDDGVKVNYGKFGDLLSEVKAVTGKK